ncbi:MAG: Beta-glucosidase-related glycosidase [Anaerocolumna sp.]|jgi:beta-glucosidase|nr:Beta-glucosidase-related glycosidase [Anaerocolumna sp.]
MVLKNQTLIKKMTLEEKAAMMSGKDTWSTVSYENIGIPSMFLADGPHGLRKQAGASDHLGLNASLPATCFPTAATVANSWDEKLGEELGEYLGEEAVSLGVNVVLGPGLNIKRSPLCGRNFEYFSEDPYLSGKMAAAYIRGIQSKGVAACPKHFAANNQELRRMASDSVVDERTFREIYTTGFEIAIKEGKAKAIMSSYNLINGIYANENAHLLQEILVDEWGFDGIVVSDWGGSNDHVLGVKHGSHLEMPSTGKMGVKEILKGIESGRLKEEVLDKRVDELLTVILDTQKAIKDGKGKVIDKTKHHEFARKVARESIVLLKNDGNILPLNQGTKVTVIGDFAETPRYQGAGSSLVNPTRLETTLNVFDESGLILNSYEKGYERNKETNEKLIEQAKIAANQSEYVLIYAGLDEISESEGMDRTHMRLPQNQIKLIEEISKVNKNVIVVLSAGSAIEMPWIHHVKAVVHGSLGGQAGASAMLDVLTGTYCPSGKLNETYPLKYEDTPAFKYFPGKERSSEYRESLFVGYRYYETIGINVLFPFGFGLSYTKFSYSDLNVSKEGVTFCIKNIGFYDGAEIPQLYIGKQSDKIFRPIRELKGFTKVFLKFGEERQVTIPFDDKTFRYFNIHTNKWELESGVYTISIGKNATEMVLQSEIMVDGTDAMSPYLKENLPAYFSGMITNVDDNQFEQILNSPIPYGGWDKDGLIDVNDTICQLYYAKSWFARFVYKVITSIKNSSEKKGKPNLNILFIYNMPFRGIAKMTGGRINMGMVKALVEIANGRELTGFYHFITSAIKKER